MTTQRWMQAGNQPSSAILVSGEQSGGACAILVITLPPHYAEADTHSHAGQTEACYVVQGTIAVTHDGYTTTLATGASVDIPAGMPHCYWNPSASAATLLMVYRPCVDGEGAPPRAACVLRHQHELY